MRTKRLLGALLLSGCTSRHPPRRPINQTKARSRKGAGRSLPRR